METILESRKKAQRARWAANKRAERERKTGKTGAARNPIDPPKSLPPTFFQQVWAERDKRRKNFPWQMPSLPKLKADENKGEVRHFTNNSNFASQDLTCDVWAAEVILGEIHPDAKITHARIARFLISEGRDHRVKPASLETKIARVRPLIRFLEKSSIWDREGPYWPKFPESVQEHGSWIEQHVNQTMGYLAALYPELFTEEATERTKHPHPKP